MLVMAEILLSWAPMDQVLHERRFSGSASIVFLFMVMALVPCPPARGEIPRREGKAVRRASVDLSAAMPPVDRTAEVPRVVPRRVVPRPVPRAPGAGGAVKAAPAAAAVDLGPSPPASSSFLALADDGTADPPDTNGAVGKDHLMVTLNSQVAFQDRNGSILRSVSLQVFWASLGGPYAFDPRVVYDPTSDRWITIAGADPDSDSGLLVGVSRTADPTKEWSLYRIDVDPQDEVWLDHPRLGFNKDWIVVEGALYVGVNFAGCDIFVFDKASLYAGGNGAYGLFQITDPRDATDPAPAITLDAAAPALYLLQEYNGSFDGKGYLRLYRIDGPVGGEVLTLGPFPEVPLPWDYAPPSFADFAPQLGSALKVQVNDAGIEQALFRDGSVWAAHTVFLPAGGAPERSAVQWVQVSTSGDVIQWGRIDDPSGGGFFGFPSIAVNRLGDALIGYSLFSPTRYPAAGYSFRYASDPPGALRANVVLKAGEAPYANDGGGGDNRWGDYSSTMVDPRDDTDLWTIQEYAASPSRGRDHWGTWWGRVSPAPAVPFRRGDSNADAAMDLSDAVAILGYLFLADPRSLACEESADADGNEELEVSDPVSLLDYLFLAGPPPPAPFVSCGPATPGGKLSCLAFPPCGG